MLPKVNLTALTVPCNEKSCHITWVVSLIIMLCFYLDSSIPVFALCSPGLAFRADMMPHPVISYVRARYLLINACLVLKLLFSLNHWVKIDDFFVYAEKLS